jgi:hypothetical protein
VRCESVGDRVVDVRIMQGLHKADEIVRQLRSTLEQATTHPWQVVLIAGDNGAPHAPTLAETHKAEAAAKLQAAADDPAIANLQNFFPGAQVVQVEDDIGASHD